MRGIFKRVVPALTLAGMFSGLVGQGSYAQAALPVPSIYWCPNTAADYDAFRHGVARSARAAHGEYLKGHDFVGAPFVLSEGVKGRALDYLCSSSSGSVCYYSVHHAKLTDLFKRRVDNDLDIQSMAVSAGFDVCMGYIDDIAKLSGFK